MNPLKIALNYRLFDSNYFSRLLSNYCINETKINKSLGVDELKLNSYQIGHLCSSKKELSILQKNVFSNVLGFPRGFFDVDFNEVMYDVKHLTNILRSQQNMGSKQELYFDAVVTMCLNNIFKFVIDHFNIPKLSNETKELFSSVGNKLEFHKSDIYNEISVNRCIDNDKGFKDIIFDTLNWLGCLNRIPNNLIRILESKGFVFFSFKQPSWCRCLNSFSVVLEDYAIIFLSNDLLPLEQNTVIFEELLQVIVSFVSNNTSIVNNSFKLKFASHCVIQDYFIDKMYCDYFSYSKICYVLNTLKCHPMVYLLRMNELQKFNKKLSYHEMKQTSEDLFEFYHRVWVESWLNKASDNQTPAIWEKLKQFSFSYEYMSNVISLSQEDINTFCFNVNADYSSTISLRIVNK